MSVGKIGRLSIVAAFSAGAVLSAANAAIVVSEVHPSGSGNAPYAADFFEITNTGPAAVDITGWRVDDNSNAFGNSVVLRGVTSIAAGQSVVFTEGNASGSNDATVQAAFRSAWFGSSVPPTFVIGGYGGSGVGLSTGGDAINIFTSAGVLVTRVDFGASTTNVTFDNAAGLNNTTISTLSAVNVNGAFLSPAGEVGSPGAIPEPGTLGLFGLCGLSLLARRRN